MNYVKFLKQFTDWRPSALYWEKFSIAEKFGKEEIQDVYHWIFNEAIEDYKLMTELAMTLKHKALEYCENNNSRRLCSFYTLLYEQTQNYAFNNLKDEQMNYFIEITE